MAGFKIADGYVSVTPDDDGFEEQLREKIQAAAEGVKANVGLGLTDDAVIELDEDVHAAIDLATEDAKANVGLGLKDDAVEALDADVKAATDLVGEDAKVKVSVDDKSAEDSGEGMGGLIVAGIVAGLGLGAPLLLAATGAAFVGIAAYALKSNKVIAADYTQLGKTAETALTQAAAPLAGVMNQNLQTLNSSIKELQPTLDGLFANLGPDITSVTGGIISFTSNALPGLSQAVNDSHDEVQAFASGLGSLGTGVGGFFTGLTRDSLTTSAGMQATFGLLGNTLTTLGSVLGSASSAISADLMAIVPAADAVLGAIDKIADPATVGAALGAFSASKFSGPIKSGLQSVSNGFLNVAAKAEGAGGVLGSVGGAAEKASGGFSTMADVMGGPWGMAIGAGVGLLSGLAGSMFNAAKASDALTLSQTTLTQSVSQDSDTAGAATAALVAQTFATDGLSKSAAAAGVSTSTWTQAVLGSSTAQQKVLDAVDKTNQATQNQAAATDNATHSTGKFSDEQKDAQEAAQGSAAATNKLTVQNQQLVNSLNAQTKQVATTIAQQTTYEQAMAALTNTQQLFNASLTAGYKSMVASAQAASLTTVANLNLGTSNYALNTSLDQTLTTYQEASTQASSYNTVLGALNGTTMSLDEAQNTLAQQMLTAKTSFKANKDSLDENTQAGIDDRQALVSAAQAITAMGVAQEQATGSVNAGNAKIQQQITAFVATTGATGKAKQAIIAYLEQIAKIPASTSTTVNVNTGAAMNSLNQISGKLASLMSTESTAGATESQLNSNANSLLHSLGHKAAGGDVSGGTAYVVGDGGRPEVFVAPTDGYIYPSVGAGQQAIAQHNAQVAGSASRGGASVTVHQYYSGSALPTVEQSANMRRELSYTLGVPA